VHRAGIVSNDYGAPLHQFSRYAERRLSDKRPDAAGYIARGQSLFQRSDYLVPGLTIGRPAEERHIKMALAQALRKFPIVRPEAPECVGIRRTADGKADDRPVVDGGLFPETPGKLQFFGRGIHLHKHVIGRPAKRGEQSIIGANLVLPARFCDRMREEKAVAFKVESDSHRNPGKGYEGGDLGRPVHDQSQIIAFFPELPGKVQEGQEAMLAKPAIGDHDHIVAVRVSGEDRRRPLSG